MAAPPYLTDDEYRFVYSRAPRLCLDLAVADADGLILSKRDIPPFQGLWHLPGGRVYYKESVAEAAARIAGAEAGITIALDGPVGHIEVLEDGEFVHSGSLVFFARHTGGTVRGSEQGREIKKWKELPEDTHPVQKDFLRRRWDEVVKHMRQTERA